MPKADTSTLVALSGLAMIFLLSHGYISHLWGVLYSASHGGPAAPAVSNPFASSVNPVVPVTVGTGGDAVVGGYPGFPVTVAGTLKNGLMTPSDPRIPPFWITNTPNAQIPFGTLQTLINLALYNPLGFNASGSTGAKGPISS